MKRSQLKGLLKEIVKGIVKEMAPHVTNGAGADDPEDDNGNYPASGISKKSAIPAGAETFDATIMFAGNSLMINTRQGHVELQLTPEQVQLLKSELNNLKEISNSNGAGPYQGKDFLAGRGQRYSNRAFEVSKGMGYKLAKNIDEKRK